MNAFRERFLPTVPEWLVLVSASSGISFALDPASPDYPQFLVKENEPLRPGSPRATTGRSPGG